VIRPSLLRGYGGQARCSRLRSHGGQVASALVLTLLATGSGRAQTPPAATSPLPLVQLERQAAAPVVITLQDALARAKANDNVLQGAIADAQSAHEDRTQARASLLPSLGFSTQYLGNQASPNPTGRFVSMDGVNMYRVWGVVHQELSANTLMLTPYRKADAAEAAARAKLEIAQLGLAVTVTKNYYALVTAERKYATAQEAAQQAQRFLDNSRQQQQLGQVAESDVIKAEISFEQQQQGYQETLLAMDNARLMLGVMLFPTLDQNFTVVDDLASPPSLPAFADVQAMAEKGNPDLRAADQALRAANQDVSAARNAFLPSLLFDGMYGIEANALALHSVVSAQPELGVLPNLGYAVTVNVSVPVWDWGNLRSKLTQTKAREHQAQVELTHTQRQVVANLYSLYNEALTAKSAVDNTRHVADLASESLRLTNLRYLAGESTALEVVDAQTTLVQARGGYVDAEARYRVALAELQTVTGSF
jgi:outer membrane protein TolC